MIRTSLRRTVLTLAVACGPIAAASFTTASTANAQQGRWFSIDRLERVCIDNDGTFVGEGSITPTCLGMDTRGRSVAQAERVCERIGGTFAVLSDVDGTATWECNLSAL